MILYQNHIYNNNFLELSSGQCHDTYLNLDMCVQAFPEAGFEIPYMVSTRVHLEVSSI